MFARFFLNVFAHHLAWVGGILTIVAVIEKIYDKSVIVPRKIIWWVAGGLLFLASYQAWLDEHRNAEVLIVQKADLAGSNHGLQNQNANLIALLGDKDRPVIIQLPHDPAVDALLQRQDRELEKLKSERLSPKKKALQLSNDIIKFLADRTRNQPSPSAVTTTREETRRSMEEFQQTYLKWMNGTAADYQDRFSLRIASLAEDVRAADLANTGIEQCEFSNGNTFAIQRCGTLIGNLAERLPQ